MSKIFKYLFLFFFIFFNIYSVQSSFWAINIISREDWWADETYRFLDSKDWLYILKKRESIPKKELTEIQKKIAEIEANKVKKANNFIVENFSETIWIKNVKITENGHKLAWPLAYSKKKVWIVIHHTVSDIDVWDDNYEMMRKIYKYHTLTKEWGDIWYNYLIWTNWEIFEWRAGGDYVVWAHDKWNNQSTIGVAFIWNYSSKNASEKQMESLEYLIKYLVEKYDMDLSEKIPFFNWCLWTSLKCQNNPLIINYNYSIIWHKDAGHTACPGEKLYSQIQELKKKLKVGIKSKNKIFLEKIELWFKKKSEDELIDIFTKIEKVLDKNKNFGKRDLLININKVILKIWKERSEKYFNLENNISFDDNNKIKVRLSYPYNDYVNLKIKWNYKPKIIKSDLETHLKFFNKNISFDKKDILLKFQLKYNKLYFNWNLIQNFDEKKFFRISVPKGDIITIKSWNRKPLWDKTWKMNDNKFRGDIVLYERNWKLEIINDVYLWNYLKWLWEVSNSTDPEKIRTIIILARTYAKWYMTKARKFEGEWFDASDDPNVFQKYLGFWLEQRSPKINKIVEETKDLIITYNWELIKPWYFSSSDWKTTSFIDYCKAAKGIPDCAYPEKFPFLVWVVDQWWFWKQKAGHWVWIPWTWLKYFSEKWWTFSMMIKYFLKWTEIQKRSN